MACIYSRPSPRQTIADQSTLKSAVLPASPMPLFSFSSQHCFILVCEQDLTGKNKQEILTMKTTFLDVIASSKLYEFIHRALLRRTCKSEDTPNLACSSANNGSGRGGEYKSKY